MYALMLLTSMLLGSTTWAAPQPDSFTFYDMLTPLAGPCDITTGPDGAIWVQDILVNKVARIDPSSGKVEEYDIPYTSNDDGKAIPFIEISNRTALACAIQPGEDGNIYAASGVRNELVRINPTTKDIKIFTPDHYDALGDLQPFNDMYRYKDGMYFTMTTAGKLVHFGYESEQFTFYDVPGGLLAGPIGVYWASDNGIWVAEFTGQKIVRFDPEDKTFQEYPLPLSGAGPAVIRAETQNSDGSYIWFTGLLSNSIGRVEMRTGNVTIFTNDLPTSFPAEDTVDPEGRIWFSSITQNNLNYVDSKTGMFSHIAIPGNIIIEPVSLLPYADIAMHYGAGNSIWFSGIAQNRVGRYQL